MDTVLVLVKVTPSWLTTEAKSNPRFSLSWDKIDKQPKEKEIKPTDDSKNIPEYLEQKNKLKKVETDEKSLIPILKKEHEDNLQKYKDNDHSSENNDKLTPIQMAELKLEQILIGKTQKHSQ